MTRTPRRSARRSHSGQTLFEMLFIIGMLLLAYFAGTTAHRTWHNGWLTAAAAVGGFVLLPVFVMLLAFIDGRLRPRMPVCAQGRCRGWQWTTRSVFETKYIDSTKEARASLDRCRCGDEYVRLGDRLMIVRGEEWHPFRRFVKRGEWREDDDPSVLKADVGEVVWQHKGS